MWYQMQAWCGWFKVLACIFGGGRLCALKSFWDFWHLAMSEDPGEQSAPAFASFGAVSVAPAELFSGFANVAQVPADAADDFSGFANVAQVPDDADDDDDGEDFVSAMEGMFGDSADVDSTLPAAGLPGPATPYRRRHRRTMGAWA